MNKTEKNQSPSSRVATDSSFTLPPIELSPFMFPTFVRIDHKYTSADSSPKTKMSKAEKFKKSIIKFIFYTYILVFSMRVNRKEKYFLVKRRRDNNNNIIIIIIICCFVHWFGID